MRVRTILLYRQVPLSCERPHTRTLSADALAVADGPGLELQLRGREWVSVPYKPDQLIVNIGDMLEATGGYCPPPRIVAAQAWRSVAQSYVIAVVPSSASRGRIVFRYSAEYLTKRLNELGVV